MGEQVSRGPSTVVIHLKSDPPGKSLNHNSVERTCTWAIPNQNVKAKVDQKAAYEVLANETTLMHCVKPPWPQAQVADGRMKTQAHCRTLSYATAIVSNK